MILVQMSIEGVRSGGLVRKGGKKDEASKLRNGVAEAELSQHQNTPGQRAEARFTAL